MDNINFIPNWYKDKCLYKIKQIFRTACIVLLIINAFVLFMLRRDSGRLKEMRKQLEAKENKTKIEVSSKRPVPVADINIIETYSYVLKYFNENVKYRLLDITANDIVIEAEARSTESYINFLKSVEFNKKFTIKHLSIPETKEDKIEFKIVLVK